MKLNKILFFIFFFSISNMFCVDLKSIFNSKFLINLFLGSRKSSYDFIPSNEITDLLPQIDLSESLSNLPSINPNLLRSFDSITLPKIELPIIKQIPNLLPKVQLNKPVELINQTLALGCLIPATIFFFWLIKRFRSTKHQFDIEVTVDGKKVTTQSITVSN